jgi:uncharacterized protein (TIGR02001 family)
MGGVALADGYEGSIKDAPAESKREFTYSFTATGTSDYVFRGISQSDNEPAIQGAINIGYGIAYAGIWASSTDYTVGNEHSNIEIDYYAGIKPTWGKANFDFGVLYYTYPGYAKDSDTIELKAGVSGEVLKNLTAGGTIYWSPDFHKIDYFVYEGTLAYAFPAVGIFTPSISGTVGKYDWDTPGNEIYNYTYWNAGLTLTVEKIALDFRYWDTDANSSTSGFQDCFGAIASTCGERFVFSVNLTLP